MAAGSLLFWCLSLWIINFAINTLPLGIMSLVQGF